MDRKGAAVIWGLVGCLGLFFVVLCGGGAAYFWLAMDESDGEPYVGPQPSLPSGPAMPSPSTPPSPSGAMPAATRHVVATVTSVNGSAPVREGARCEFNVDRRERGAGHWCNAQVVCGGKLLYGGPNAGYFECTLAPGNPPHVAGGEDGTTSQDRDAAMRLDTRAGTLTIRDDAEGAFGAYTLNARVDTVR